jgi:hypothetical protein
MPPYTLTWSYSGEGASKVDETLAVDERGGVWFWLLAAAEHDRADRAGSFALEPDQATAKEVGQLAAALRELPLVAEELPLGGVSLTIQAGDRGHVLNATSRAARTAVIDEALAVAERLRGRVLASPRAALQIALRAEAAPAGAPATIHFEVTSIGSEPVRFLIDSGAFAVFGFDEAGETFTWRSVEGETLGLIDEETGDSLEGVLVEATMPGGARGLATFDHAMFAEPGRYTLTGSMNGKIVLIRPDGPPPPPMPNTQFWLTTPRTSWTAK